MYTTIRRNIIFVINSPFPYYAGGIETWLFNLSSRLCVDNNVTIISEAKTLYRDPFFILDERIRIINYKTLHSSSFLRKILRGELRVLNSWNVISNIERILYNLINNEETHYVVALNTLFAASAVNKVRQKKNNIKFICSARCPHAEITSKKFPLFSTFYYGMEKTNLLGADIALSNGYDTIDYFKKRGISTFLMKNGVDTEKFFKKHSRPQEELPVHSFNIISVATLLDIKGIQEMIKAIALLVKREHCDISLVLIGKGAQIKYQQQAKELGIADRVLFLGHKSNVAPYLQHADLICCLSGGSGLSMSALEAMASHKPIVAWDTPVYRQFNKNGKTMVLVEEKNIEALAGAIEGIIYNPDEYIGMTKQASIEVCNYDWSIVVNDFINYLK